MRWPVLSSTAPKNCISSPYCRPATGGSTSCSAMNGVPSAATNSPHAAVNDGALPG
ncbi:MAG TPA: hypothetical protein VER58_03120 [Thermoanaerobaculia bacterium]|nr:hypothetical protein [Thermoanaerobaculia bacterium]